MDQFQEASNRQNIDPSDPVNIKKFSNILQSILLPEKFRKLVQFLLCKHQRRELQVTMDEIMCNVHRHFHNELLEVFQDFCESMLLGFGIDIRKTDPSVQTYDLVPLLGLTFHGLLSNDADIVPKIDILIFALSIILIEGNRVSEEKLRENLDRWEMLSHMDNIYFLNPWRFITEDLVYTQYLEYQQVPNSDPACYEFFWGPRAHAETTKMKVLEHISRLNGEVPTSYVELYEEALNEERVSALVLEGENM